MHSRPASPADRARPVLTLIRPGAAIGFACGLAMTATAHDEDWRKYADRLPPRVEPIYRRGDPPTPGALPRVTPDGTEPVRSRAELARNGVDCGGFDCLNFTLMSQLPISAFALSNSDGSDCWGYVSPSGREYGIVSFISSLAVVEITDPVNPVILQEIPSASSFWHDIKVIGEYAYAVSEGGLGVQVVDLSNVDGDNPGQPRVTLVRNFQFGGHSTTHNIVSNPETGSLWLSGSNLGNGGLLKLDLSDPTRPRVTSGYTDHYVHDAQVVVWKTGSLAGRELAFTASGGGIGQIDTAMRVVDVTDPTNPVRLSTLRYPSSEFSHQLWLSEDHKYAYHNDEGDEQFGLVPTTTTRVINIEDPANPFLVGTFTSGRGAIDHNLYVDQGLIYQANYRSGLRVFETSDPENPTEIAFFDTFPGSDGPQFNGAWSVYPFFPSGNVIVSDIDGGFFVLRPDAADGLVTINRVGPATPAVLRTGGEIAFDLTPFASELDAGSVELILSTNTGTLGVTGTEIAADDDANPRTRRFSFDLPDLPCDGPVTVSLLAAADTGAQFVFPENGQPLTLTAVDALEPTFADSADAGTGWSVGGSVSDGAWAVGVPAGGGTRSDPPADFDGSGGAFLTDNVEGNSDVDDGTTILTSPAFDTTGGAVIGFAYWFGGFGNDGVNDTFDVEVSFNDGLTWTPAFSTNELQNAWRTAAIDIAPASGTASTRVRFLASDVAPQSVIEAGVDAVRVTLTGCTGPEACSAADLAAPLGVLDSADIGAFLAGPASQPGATFLGVLDYLATFDAGCD